MRRAVNSANDVPLTPTTFLLRAAEVFPDRIAVIHGPRRFTYAEFHARSRRLASALAARGVGEGDTVSVMLTAQELIAFARENLPHFAVPRAVVFGPLPTTATGKIQKYELRRRAREL